MNGYALQSAEQEKNMLMDRIQYVCSKHIFRFVWILSFVGKINQMPSKNDRYWLSMPTKFESSCFILFIFDSNGICNENSSDIEMYDRYVPIRSHAVDERWSTEAEKEC